MRISSPVIMILCWPDLVEALRSELACVELFSPFFSAVLPEVLLYYLTKDDAVSDSFLFDSSFSFCSSRGLPECDRCYVLLLDLARYLGELVRPGYAILRDTFVTEGLVRPGFGLLFPNDWLLMMP